MSCHAAEQERLNEIARTPGSVYHGLWAEEPDDPFGGIAQAVREIDAVSRFSRRI